MNSKDVRSRPVSFIRYEIWAVWCREVPSWVTAIWPKMASFIPHTIQFPVLRQIPIYCWVERTRATVNRKHHGDEIAALNTIDVSWWQIGCIFKDLHPYFCPWTILREIGKHDDLEMNQRSILQLSRERFLRNIRLLGLQNSSLACGIRSAFKAVAKWACTQPLSCHLCSQQWLKSFRVVLNPLGCPILAYELLVIARTFALDTMPPTIAFNLNTCLNLNS